MFENRAPHMIKNDWHPYSALGIILKDAGIVTEAARKEAFPVPLASAAEQEYLRGVQAGFLRDDDAKLVQLYLPKDKGDLVATSASADIKMNSNYQISKDTINDLLSGIHLAASVEGMAFCKKLGVDSKIMYEIISKAAGWNAMFTTSLSDLLEKDTWTLAESAHAKEVGEKLAAAVEKCNQIKYPCPMATAALQQFFFAAK
jgi:3-hydroxyisobutyrate dehydrogenase